MIGTAFATVFFSSPAKGFLVKRINARSGTPGSSLHRSQSQESIANKEPILGLPAEPGEDLGEIMAEVQAELERQKATNRQSGSLRVERKH